MKKFMALTMMLLFIGSSVATSYATTYTVKSGDVLWKIARDHQTSVDKLVEMNDINNRNLIFPGQSLKITSDQNHGHSTNRIVAVDGLLNMRDLGHVESTNGTINAGMLFRSETPYYLSDDGIKTFDTMDFDIVVDFRGDDEIEHHPNKGMDRVDYVNIPVSNPADLAELIPVEHMKEIRQTFATGDFDRFNELLDEYNINLADQKLHSYESFANYFDKEFSEFLHLLLKPENKKVLFHCEGGKDRTGYAAALFYKLLGVDNETIYEDFLLTNSLTAEKNAPILAKLPESLYPTIIADVEHLKAPFAWIDSEYGSLDNYRRTVLDISDDELELLINKYTK